MDESKPKSKHEYSAGGIVVALRGGVPCVAMIATKSKTRWGLPKGAVSLGESAEQAAVREVQEETGIEAEIVTSLPPIEYFFRASGTRIQKRVDFYLMRFLRGEITPQLSEVDAAEWVPLDEAIARSSFDSERKLLESVGEAWGVLQESERVAYEGERA